MIAGLGAVFAGGVTRKRLRRFRVSKPQPLGLVPKLKRPPTNGLFVAFEGVEGSGKGTQIRLAREWLESQGIEVLVTREPGGTPVGEDLRKLLLGHDTGHIEPKTEALMFAASRAQHVASVIRPALAEGKVVICDRYIDSSVAYQGWARGLGEQDVLTLNVWATQGLFPDLVHPAPPRAGGRAAPVARGTRPDRARGGGLPREGGRRVPSDRGGASGAVRRGRCGPAPGGRPRGGRAGPRPRAEGTGGPWVLTATDRPSRCSTACRVRSTPSRSCGARRTGPTTRTCSPGPRAAGSSSRPARSRPRSCASRADAGPAATAVSRWTIATRTWSSSSPRGATSTWTRSAPRCGTPRTGPRRNRGGRSSCSARRIG